MELKQQYYSTAIRPALVDLQQRLSSIEWSRAAISGVVKEILSAHRLKMPAVAMPLRVMVAGRAQTPAIDATLELIGRDHVLARMRTQLQHFPA